MITQQVDFAGNYRIPTGVPAADITAAIQQGDMALLREVFEEDTAVFIAAAPAQPPASTLQAGIGGLNFRWSEASVPAIYARTTWGVTGMGATVGKTKNTTRESPGHLIAAVVLNLLRVLIERLIFVSRTYWTGDGTVVNVTPTTVDITLPVPSWEWLRAGSTISLRHPLYASTVQVQSTTAPNLITVGIAGFPGAPGDTIGFVIELKLRKRKDLSGLWI